MDAAPLYPHGFHPIQQDFSLDLQHAVEALPRSSTLPPVKYYFTDFGISTYFDDDTEPRLVLGEDGLDASVPELSAVVPYDPFKVDVFILGNFFKKAVIEVGTYEWFSTQMAD